MYDGSGAVVGMRYKSNASAQYVDYYYVKNAQGDITGIVDKDGVLKYTYEYDSWGKLLNIKTSTGSVLNPAVINYATQNPFRYRGYYYDNETGFYYLNSRYYDPTVKRFINADSSSLIGSTPGSLSDNNLYNYCDNNPIIRYDDGGKFWETVFDIFSLATSVIDVINNPEDPMAWVGLVGDALDLIPFVTGVGETVRIVNTTKKVVNRSDDIADIVKTTDKVVDTSKSINSLRRKAVRDAWKAEKLNVMEGNYGISRRWTREEREELLAFGKVKNYQGHHMKSVKAYPEKAGDPTNIQFLTRSEHLAAHGGNFRNPTHGRFQTNRMRDMI